MEPAFSVIRKLGGVVAVAKIVGRNRTSVLRWTHAREKGGTGGLIPAKHQAELLRVARERSVRLKASDFFTVESIAA